MDAGEETLNVLSNIWAKLRALPNANHVELGAFFIVLTFISVVLLMTVLTCVSCCCCRRRRETKLKVSNV